MEQTQLEFGWATMYTKYNEKERRHKALVKYNESFFEYMGIDDSAYKKIDYGTFTHAKLSDFDKRKATVIQLFSAHARKMKKNYEKKGWTAIAQYNKEALCGYHWWNNADAFEYWHLGQGCRLCLKFEKEQRKYQDFNQHEAKLKKKHDAKTLRGNEWIMNNLMPPIGHSEWTPTLLAEINRSCE